MLGRGAGVAARLRGVHGPSTQGDERMPWWIYAGVSALAAAATAILAKLGVEHVPSTLATAIRTLVVVAFTWLLAIGLNEHRAIPTLSRSSLVFLALSGVATGVSWLAYFRALQLAPASWVAPIDKLSLPLTIVLAALILGETVTWRAALGVSLMAVGALLTRF
jgi:transporter family protein